MLMTEETGAIAVLKNQHQTIKDLFRQFEDAATDRQKKSIGDAALREVEALTHQAEEIFYPAVRRLGERKGVVRAQAAHAIAKLIIKELKLLAAGEHFNTRFEVLMSNVRHQIDEVEAELVPLIEKSEVDLEQLGSEMIELKGRIASRNRNAMLRKSGAIALGVAAVGALAYYFSTRKDRD
jgi:ElaB/YqjD/DUF883 family membrane-anchored ribosome-binding protein